METMEAVSSRAYYRKEAYSNEEEIRPVKRSPRLTDETITKKYNISKRKRARKNYKAFQDAKIAAEEIKAQAQTEESLEEWIERVGAEYNDAELAKQAKYDEEYRVWAEKQADERSL